jgi:hypothetical protein
MIKSTKTQILPNCQGSNGYFCINLQVIYNCSSFGSSYFYVSFSRDKKSERIERNLKHKIQTLDNCHDTIAYALCNQIIAEPLSFHVKLHTKLLGNLRISIDDFTRLKEIKALYLQMIESVKGQAHDMFSRISPIRIHDFFAINIV